MFKTKINHTRKRVRKFKTYFEIGIYTYSNEVKGIGIIRAG